MFEYLCNTKSDINEHLPALRDLAKECNSVVEMGVRTCVSTWAFIEGMNGGSLVSIDIKHPSKYGADITPVEKACKNKGITFKFYEADTLTIDIPEVDMLFIDTLHEYGQLKGELAKHGDKAKKYLVFHDTVSCEDELMPAINEFLKENKKWKIKEHYTFNNGVLVLARV